ncbi:MAG: Na/Pi cotransporter family protein [Thermoanaerobaculia bacterium]
MAILPMAMFVVGGLGLFMLGMKYMSEGMQAVAGNSLRRMISLVTDRRLLAIGTGTAVTLLVQSSSITTVIVVGLVNAGLMQLHQAVGVILGANIGTTITGWILVLQIGKYGLPILGLASLIYLFARRDRPKFVAMAIMGMGMIFFGLELMKDGFAPIRDVPTFMDAFAWFQAGTYPGVLLCVLVGCIFTVLVQSSSATLGITIGLAATGVISFPTAAALVLGENIGTTITVVIASVGANVNAKRAAYAHVLFNVFGVFWITLLFQGYVRLVSRVIQGTYGVDPMVMTLAEFESPLVFAATMTAAIALTHTGFNVTNTAVFLPFLTPFGRLLQRLVPDPKIGQVARLKHLEGPAVAAPVLGVEQSRGEVIQMGRGVVKMIDWIRQLGFNGPYDEGLVQKTFHREEVLDNVQREIVTFLTDLLDATVPHAIAEEGRRQLRLAHEYESMSDRLADILRGYAQLRERRLELSADQKAGLLALHDAVAGFLRRVTEAYAERRTVDDDAARTLSSAIIGQVRKLRDDHLRQMTDHPVDPSLSLLFTDILADYQRVRAHTMNVQEAMAGIDATAGG